MIQRRNFIGGMAAILAGAAAPAFIRHAMPVKMVGSIATLEPPWGGVFPGARYIKHVGIGDIFGSAFISQPMVPLGLIYAFAGGKLPVGWEYIDVPV